MRGDLGTIRRDSSGLYTEYKDMTAIAKKGGIIGIWPLLRRRDTLETYLRSIDYVKNLVRADHLGIATDLFGLAGSSAVPSHKEFAIIPAGLLQRGYSQTHVAKIVGGNFIRVFREVTDPRMNDPGIPAIVAASYGQIFCWQISSTMPRSSRVARLITTPSSARGEFSVIATTS